MSELPEESPPPSDRAPGIVYTFYSYKGGVGRSMALVNTGVLMALAGKRVLLIDWDLEAPGLEAYFRSDSVKLNGDVTRTPGVIDLLESREAGSPLDWHTCLLDVSFLGSSLHVISAGRRTDDYRSRVQRLDWEALYGEHRIGNYINGLRSQWQAEYDFILVDSRTGITDIGDVCLVLLPDVVVLMFVTNYQNLEGIKSAMRRATAARKQLPVDRSKLLGVPLPGRDEIYNEYEKANEWKSICARDLGYLYKEWLPKEVEPRDVLHKLFIPYVSNWSFGERIPVLESARELQDPTAIGAAYGRIASLLMSGLDWYSVEQKATREELRGTRVELQKAREDSRLKQEELERHAVAATRRRRYSLGGVAILTGILAAIFIPAYQDYTIRAKITEGLNLADGLKTAVAETFAEKQSLPNSNAEVGLKAPLSGRYVSGITLGKAGIITLSYPSDVAGGGRILLTPAVTATGDLVWSCSSPNIGDSLLPSVCRKDASASVSTKGN